MNAQAYLVALAIKHNGEWREIYSEVKSKSVPEDAYVAKGQAMLDAGLAITIMDPRYPRLVAQQTPQPPFVLFLKEGDLSGIDLNKSTAYVQRARGMDTDEKDAATKLDSLMSGKGRQVCFLDPKTALINIVDYETGNHIALSTQMKVKKTPMAFADARKNAVGFVDEAFFFKAPKRSAAILEIALLLNRGVDRIHVLPHRGADAEDETCELISDGALNMEDYLYCGSALA